MWWTLWGIIPSSAASVVVAPSRFRRIAPPSLRGSSSPVIPTTSGFWGISSSSLRRIPTPSSTTIHIITPTAVVILHITVLVAVLIISIVLRVLLVVLWSLRRILLLWRKRLLVTLWRTWSLSCGTIVGTLLGWRLVVVWIVRHVVRQHAGLARGQ